MVLALAGCFGAVRLVTSVTTFDHAAHGNRDLSCTDCHDGPATKPKPGMPAVTNCTECHDPATEKKEINKVVDDFKVAIESKAYPSAVVWIPTYEDVKFDHGKHAATMGKCITCHTGVEQVGMPANIAGPIKMDACMACHKERGVANDCATCHEKQGKTTKPANHDTGWTQHHGVVSRMPDKSKVVERCDVCHTRGSCDTCHEANPPKDHTNPFRTRTHGLQASMDRSRCLSCHRTDSCDTCHQSAPPRSHNTSWGETKDTHCLSCHDPVSAESCAVCHAGTPSHALAAPKPAVPVHSSAMNCRQCHGIGVKMPHVDNGTNCNNCHK